MPQPEGSSLSAPAYHPDGANPDRYDAPIFQALLVPYRSLGQTGFFILMTALISCWLFIGILFWSIGAWPIFGFFGLDVLAIYLAFRWNYRAARVREEISVSRRELQIKQVAPSGKITTHSFHPFWTRFRVHRRTGIGRDDKVKGIAAMHVVSREKQVLIGSFLNPDDRESFAAAFRAALAEARR
ncbi:DUF2244 domain-containing protein [Daeguia caeni]|uniref:DUF2244 domain-containing protein n=1 Tax=Daeguia caeni TaxID=439612 RepID=A0ABV9H2N9_9HYPH